MGAIPITSSNVKYYYYYQCFGRVLHCDDGSLIYEDRVTNWVVQTIHFTLRKVTPRYMDSLVMNYPAWWHWS